MQLALQRTPGGAVEERFVDVVFQPISEADGQVSGIFVQGSDVTERERAETHRELLVHELDHRVKNVLATAQSVALQTLPRDAASETFLGRLAALARAHGLLLREPRDGAALRALVDGALAPYRPEQIEIGGADVLLDPKAAQILSMTLHELATNAAKYGALSESRGRLEVFWKVEGAPDGRRLTLHWAERDGPPVKAPERSGFGSKLITQGLAYELGGEARLAYPPEGLRCALVVPLPSKLEAR